MDTTFIYLNFYQMVGVEEVKSSTTFEDNWRLKMEKELSQWYNGNSFSTTSVVTMVSPYFFPDDI